MIAYIAAQHILGRRSPPCSYVVLFCLWLLSIGLGRLAACGLSEEQPPAFRNQDCNAFRVPQSGEFERVENISTNSFEAPNGAVQLRRPAASTATDCSARLSDTESLSRSTFRKINEFRAIDASRSAIPIPIHAFDGEARIF
jgi:hypothetical protein